ncbi:hypothetical protein [Janthinobacterium sp. RB2R34]|uniref:hypothetical protein n=1 Tax=Janthinobacterium sp. RB2R34 TaxID=3424193 RepID=UPI003F523155
MSTYKGTIEIEAVDIPTMARMSDDEYQKFLETDGLLRIDHHDILRSAVAEYPLATRRSQLDMLISALQQCRERMREDNPY